MREHNKYDGRARKSQYAQGKILNKWKNAAKIAEKP